MYITTRVCALQCLVKLQCESLLQVVDAIASRADWASVERARRQSRATGRGKAHIEDWNILQYYRYGEAESVTPDYKDVDAGSTGGRWAKVFGPWLLGNWPLPYPPTLAFDLQEREGCGPTEPGTQVEALLLARCAARAEKAARRRLRQLSWRDEHEEQNECLWRAMQVEAWARRRKRRRRDDALTAMG